MKIRRELSLEEVFTSRTRTGKAGDWLRIGPFLITPPWVENSTAEGFIKILLDPGVVFGNCLHPTTRTCLEALSIVAKQSCIGRVLDLGTGTGILALGCGPPGW